jgi:hypothetical protein
VPELDWGAELSKRALDYPGEVHAEAQNITLEQVAPSSILREALHSPLRVAIQKDAASDAS